MRNLKKFLAVLVVVAMMATSMMSAFAAADPAMTPAEKAEGLGLLKGGADGKVDEAYLNLTTQRIQTAIIYLRLMGKEAEARAYTATTDNFADSNLVSGDAVNLLAYLRANPQLGWVGDGTNFNPLGEVSGQALYKVMLTAVGYTQGLDFDYADTIGFARAKGFSLAAYVGYADSVTNNGMAAAMIEALGTNMNGKTTTLAAKLVADKVITEADASKYTSYVIAATPTPVPVSAFAITSVTATDLKSATVKFNMAVDATEGAKAANYTVNDAAAAKVVLAADKMSAVVTLAAAIGQQGTIKVVLKKAAIASTATADATLTSDKITDTTIPTVKSVVVTGNNKIVVTYSEPVQNADYLGNFTIDGAVYSAYAPTVSTDGLTTTINLTQRLAAGAHKVVVSSNVKDYANIPVAPNSFDITVATDTTAPAKVTLVGDATQTKVVAEFDKDIASVASVKAGSIVGTPSYDGKKVTVEFPYNAALPASTSVLTFTDVTDFYGNKATLTLSVTPVLDTVRPTYVGVAQVDDTHFTVEYSKEVVYTTGTYTLKDKDGNIVGVTKQEFTESGATSVNKKKVKLEVAASTIDVTSKGPWSLAISGVTDNTALTNVIVDYTAAGLTFADKTKPQVSSARYTSGQKLYVTFNEKVDAATATTAANYTLITSANVSKALESGTTLAVQADGTTVLITFPSTFTISGTTAAYLNISNVKDVALNTIDTVSVVPSSLTPTAAALSTAQVTAKNTIKVVHTGSALNAGTLVPYDFVISNGADTLTATAVSYDTATSTITLTIAQDIKADGTYNNLPLKVYTVASPATKNFDGTALTAITTFAAGVPVADYSRPTATAIAKAYYDAGSASTVIRVSIDEPLTTVNLTQANGQFAMVVDGVARTFTVTNNGSIELIFTAATAVTTNKAYTVTFTPFASSAVTDLNGAVTATNDRALKAFTFTGTLE